MSAARLAIGFMSLIYMLEYKFYPGIYIAFF